MKRATADVRKARCRRMHEAELAKARDRGYFAWTAAQRADPAALAELEDAQAELRRLTGE